MTISKQERPDTQFTISAILTLALVILGARFTSMQIAHQFTVPTDGWAVSENVDFGFIYVEPISAEPSALKPGDHVIAVDGLKADYDIMIGDPVLTANWVAGSTHEYTVVRGEEEILAAVKLTNWDLGRLLRLRLFTVSSLAGFFSNLFLLMVAFFIFLRRPGNRAAGAFLLISSSLFIASISGSIPGGFSAWLDAGNIIYSTIAGYYLFGILPYALVQFALVFPRPKPVYLRNRWLPIAVGFVGPLFSVLFPLGPLVWFWFVLTFFITLGILIHNAMTMREAVSRAQLRWGVGGMGIGLGILGLSFLVNTIGLVSISDQYFEIIFGAATAIMGGMLAVGISRYRLFDIDVIIRRTLLYTLLTGILVLSYFSVVVLLQAIIERLSGDRSSPLITVISTLVIAALFTPLRNRTQGWIDRRFFRSKYDAELALNRFADAARDEVDMDRLIAAMLGTVTVTMQPEQASLWLIKDPRSRFDNG